MNKFFNIENIFLLGLVVFLVFLGLSFENNSFSRNLKSSLIENNIKKKACVQEKCFQVEIADSAEEIRTGLMHRKSLASNEGMLFIFPRPGYYNFWMKNTLIPLDMIWLNKAEEIVFIKHQAQPCLKEPCSSFGPNQRAKYVLEINGGLASDFNFEKGDQMILKY